MCGGSADAPSEAGVGSGGLWGERWCQEEPLVQQAGVALGKSNNQLREDICFLMKLTKISQHHNFSHQFELCKSEKRAIKISKVLL